MVSNDLLGQKAQPVFSGMMQCASVLVGKGRFGLKHYRQGETIVVQGDDECRAFIIRDGWGCVSRNLRNGERQLIEFVLCGDVMDCSTVATGRQEEFAALTDMIVWEGCSARMWSLAEAEPAVGRFMAEGERRRRALLVERLADIAQRDSASRIAHFLLELGARLSLNGVATRHGYQCPLIQQDIADALGLTPIHLNRMLREARSLGLYEFRRGRVEFLDYRATVDFANFDTDFLSAPEVMAPPVHRAVDAHAARP